ncbi:hypothetical protein FB451DRAFT_1050704, partial [Mycena latifolia]
LDQTYKDVLHTNFVPSDQECRRIRDFVVAPTDKLQETTEEIARLEALLEQLTRQRDELAEYIDSHLALVAPARRLPEDILREIFIATLPLDRHPGMSPRASPLLISRICNDWRTLALSMPRLWASLHIDASELSPRSPRLKECNEGLESQCSPEGLSLKSLRP